MLDFIQLGLAALFNMPPTAATRGQRGGGGCDGEMKHAGSQKKWRQKRRDGERRRKNEGQRQKWSLWNTRQKRRERNPQMFSDQAWGNRTRRKAVFWSQRRGLNFLTINTDYWTGHFENLPSLGDKGEKSSQISEWDQRDNLSEIIWLSQSQTEKNHNTISCSAHQCSLCCSFQRHFKLVKKTPDN